MIDIENNLPRAERKMWEAPRMNRLDAGDAELGIGIITEANTGNS